MSEQERVISIVGEEVGRPVGDLHMDTRFVEDLGVSSLQILALHWRLEKVFQLPEVSPSKLQSVTTIGDLVELVDQEISECAGESGESEEDGDGSTTGDYVFDVAVASDHAGVVLKSQLTAYLRAQGYLVADLGPQTSSPVDYPNYAALVSDMVTEEKAHFGLLICGSGIGMSMAANRRPGIRAALVNEPLSAKLSRQHNNANVICLGARLIGTALAETCLDAFLSTEFDPGDDGRHRRRIELFDGASAEE